MEESLVRPDDLIAGGNQNKVNVDMISEINHLKSEANTNNDTMGTNIRNHYFKDDVIKQELNVHERTVKCSIDDNNSSNSNISQIKTSSYINEFYLFLKKYEENRDNPNTTVMEPYITNLNETEEFTDLHEKLESLNSTKLGDYSDNAITFLKCHTEIDANIAASKAHIKEPFNPFNIDIECTNAENVIKNYNTSFESINELSAVAEKEKVNIEEINSIISIINSERSKVSIDEFKTDPSVNYTSISETKLDFSDQLIDDDFDCEGYHSSDFEFISEQDAGLEGILINSCSGTQSNSFKHNKSKRDAEETYDLDRPGPSRLEYNRNRLHPNGNSDTDDGENNNHMVPEGEDLYELFAEPWSVFNFQAESKAFFSNRAMHFDTDNIALNVGILHQTQKEDDVDASVKQEALENEQKIVSMYPSENRRLRRPTRFTKRS